MGEGTVQLAEWALANVLTLKRGLLWSFLFSLSPFKGEVVALCLVVDKPAVLKQRCRSWNGDSFHNCSAHWLYWEWDHWLLRSAAQLGPEGCKGGSTFGHEVGGPHSLKLAFLLCQHLQEQLDLDLSPLEYMLKCYPEIKEKEEMRKIIGRYGLTGKQQVSMSCWGFLFGHWGGRAAAFSVALLMSDSMMQYAAWYTTASKCFCHLCFWNWRKK